MYFNKLARPSISIHIYHDSQCKMIVHITPEIILTALTKKGNVCVCFQFYSGFFNASS